MAALLFITDINADDAVFVSIQRRHQLALLRVPDFDGAVVGGGDNVAVRHQLQVGQYRCVTL